MIKVAFLGGGSFATALSHLLSKKGYKTVIWARNIDVVKDINTNKKNTKYLPNVTLEGDISATTDMREALKDATYVIIAVSSHSIREVAKKASPYIKKDVRVINVAKGIEEGSYKLLTEVIEEELPNNPVAVLSGPSHAEEVGDEIPTTVVASAKNMALAEEIQDLFMTSYFRVYTNDDLVGVEIGGAIKNIIAFAAGICDGIGYGDNAKAALMTRGMSEIIRAGEALGGNKETFFGLTGMGDLIVTCTSIHSRNRRAGILIGKGKSLEEATKEVGMVVEGVKACKVFYHLKEEKNISMPITNSLYEVLFHGKNPETAVMELMMRDRKREQF